jgi:hypothetical protein
VCAYFGVLLLAGISFVSCGNLTTHVCLLAAMRKAKLPRQQQPQQRPGQARERDRAGAQPRGAAAGGRFGDRKGAKGGKKGPYFRRQRMDKLPSVNVESNWEIVAEMDLPQLSKLSAAVPKPDQVQDLYWCGYVDQYNEAFDRLSSRNPQRLQTFNRRTFYSVTTKGKRFAAACFIVCRPRYVLTWPDFWCFFRRRSCHPRAPAGSSSWQRLRH